MAHSENPPEEWRDPLIWCDPCLARKHHLCKGWTEWCPCGCGIEWTPLPRPRPEPPTT